MYLVLAAHLAFLLVCWFAPMSPEDQGVALLVVAPVQAMMLVIWLVLARSRFVLRLFVLFAVLVNWVVFESLGDLNPSAMAFYLTPLLVIVVGGLGVMRLLGWRVQILQPKASSNFSTDAPQPPQFTLRQIGIAVTAISLVFAVNMYFQIAKEVLGDNEVLAIFLLTLFSFALAIWATLGAGRLTVRLLIYAAATSALIVGLIMTIPSFANDSEFVLKFLVPDVVIVPLTLLAFRLAGYRVMRQATESKNGEAAVVVGSP